MADHAFAQRLAAHEHRKAHARPDPDRAAMLAALDALIGPAQQWRRTGRPSKRKD